MKLLSILLAWVILMTRVISVTTFTGRRCGSDGILCKVSLRERSPNIFTLYTHTNTKLSLHPYNQTYKKLIY